MFYGKFCVPKKILHYSGISDYQCHHCACLCQICKFPFEGQTKYFFFFCNRGNSHFEETQSHFKVFLEMYVVVTVRTKFVFTFYPIERVNVVATLSNSANLTFTWMTFHSTNRKLRWIYMVETVYLALQKKTNPGYKVGKASPLWQKHLRQKTNHTRNSSKKV